MLQSPPRRVPGRRGQIYQNAPQVEDLDPVSGGAHGCLFGREGIAGEGVGDCGGRDKVAAGGSWQGEQTTQESVTTSRLDSTAGQFHRER